jgi:hypothetical protein
MSKKIRLNTVVLVLHCYFGKATAALLGILDHEDEGHYNPLKHGNYLPNGTA